MKSMAPAADDYQSRIAKILGISVDTLMNAEKQAREAAKGTMPTLTEGSKDARPTPPTDMSVSVAKTLGISVETLTAAEKQVRSEMEAERKAQTPATPPVKDEILSKVAQILGITTDKLTSAMQQASKAISETNLTNELTSAVTNNTITQDEANQIKEWLAKKPAALDKLPGFDGFGGMMGPGGRGMGLVFGPGEAWGPVQSPAVIMTARWVRLHHQPKAINIHKIRLMD
jgi:DNA-binding XRE family transcriptional regulator